MSSEHTVLVCDVDELDIILTLPIGYERQIRIALLTVFADNQRVVLVVLLEEFLGVGVAVDVDLGQGVEDCLLLIAALKSCFQEW